MIQLPIFPETAFYRPLPDVCRTKHGGDQKSEAANRKVHASKQPMRDRILALLLSGGRTSKEIAGEVNRPLHAISGRLTELLAAGKIYKSEDERDGCAVLKVAK